MPRACGACRTLSRPRAQTNNFFGKLLMWATFAGVAFIRSTKDLDQYKELLKEVRLLLL